MSTIRSEFADRRRHATIATGAHGPVTLTAELLAARDAAYY